MAKRGIKELARREISCTNNYNDTVEGDQPSAN
jgi:hypothetical protein